MNCTISYLTRLRKGGFAHRDVNHDVDVVTLGRAANATVFLDDPRVPLDAAQLHRQPGGLFIEAAGQSELRHNGVVTGSAKLAVGDKLTIGPYDLEVVEPEDGKDLKLTVELARPLGDDLEQLAARSTLALEETWLSRRGTAWVLGVLVLALFLIVPVVAFFTGPDHEVQKDWPVTTDLAWESGEISGPHKFFGINCNACHVNAFEQVTDNACLDCHQGISHHAEAKRFETAADGDFKCETCHKEHNGNAEIVLTAQALCSDCHSGLSGLLEKVELKDVGDFADDHPQFMPTVVTDFVTRKLERISLDDKPRLKEISGLKFPHDKHLTEENGGVKGPDGRRVMQCGDCHQVENGGLGMQAIKMEQHCAECHKLNFDARKPERTVPHGKPVEVQEIIRDFYAKLALEGGVDDPSAPAVVRRRPGTPILTEQDRFDALNWARVQAQISITGTFGKRLCGSCHTVSEDAEGRWDVVKPLVVDRWMTLGYFHHDSHKTIECGDCHEAKTSKVSSDVLLPDIASCRDCHGGESASRKVPSSCVMCHDFHIEGQPPMGNPHARMAAGAAVSRRQ